MHILEILAIMITGLWLFLPAMVPNYAALVFATDLKMDFGTAFKKSVEFRDAKAELLTGYNDDFDFEELGKMAIDYSDGIVLANKEVNKNLLKYAKDKNVPVLPYHEDFADAYEAFYDQLCPDTEE
jgi:starch synthase